MSAVEECLLVTKALYTVILNGSEKPGDEWVAQMNELFNRREAILPAIKEPFTDEEKEMGKQIITLNTQIEKALHKNRNEVQSEMGHLRSKKTNMKRYINPYDQVDRDGTFYDKRN
ncbi:hypothetical protein [Jeotgalibacillus proteolyticus]|uniref:Flagellar protein FliT n=1 Tax=Jeotgalibacillus proteolyticus TaxID=2082395 RepID=A0A2S5GB32_9BACL|nr:hypothetical protein [Jeotgalibacillus proteolyticus]PPA70237.1 hypothetical protein C4B60_11690 [Jeotgalibacillus proteolyticus]